MDNQAKKRFIAALAAQLEIELAESLDVDVLPQSAENTAAFVATASTLTAALICGMAAFHPPAIYACVGLGITASRSALIEFLTA